MKQFSGILAAFVLYSALWGCNKQEAKGQLDAAGDAMSAAGNKMEEAGDKMAGAAGAALDTAKVKAAIVADATLNDPKNEINVDVTDKAVFLKGHVANNDLKKKAGEIAEKTVKDAASALPVKNMLLIK